MFLPDAEQGVGGKGREGEGGAKVIPKPCRKAEEVRPIRMVRRRLSRGSVRRGRPSSLLLLGFLFGLLSLAGTGCGEKRPDIVLVVVDALRADHLPTYGYHLDTAPAIDSLARRGVVFERAFSHSGWTLPSMASMLTGLHPTEHGAYRSPKGGAVFGRLRPEVTTMAEALAGEGYTAAAFVNNVYLRPLFGLDGGFELYDLQPASNLRHRSARATVEDALAWMKEAEGPLFVLIHIMEPHLNYDPPAPARGRFLPPAETVIPVPYTLGEGQKAVDPSEGYRAQVEGLYDEEILETDTALGPLFDAFEGRAFLFVTADHGEEFWDHGGFEHGHSLHGELVRVPLIMSGPGLEPGRIDAAVQHVDLFQTIVGLAGAGRPEGTGGVDLRSVAASGGAGFRGRAILHEDRLFGSWQAALTTDSYRLVVTLPDGSATLWSLDGDGQNDRMVSDRTTLEKELPPRLEALFRIRRGRGAPEPPVPVERRMDRETREELRSLGYLR